MAPTLDFFGFELPSYTVMILIGFTAGLFVAQQRRRLYGLRRDVLLAAYFMAGVGAFIGGKLFFIVQGWSDFLTLHEAGMSFFEYFSRAGLVFYGGMAGTLAGLFAAGPLLQEPQWPLLDTLLPSLPLAQAFGRIGCLLAGCCYGVPVSWGVYMTGAGGAPQDVALLPVQLLEAAGAAALFVLLDRLGSRRQPPGFLLSIYLLIYGTMRFVLEFFRYDAVRGSIGPFSVSQWCSFVAVGAGLLLALYSRRRAARAQSGTASLPPEMRRPS